MTWLWKWWKSRANGTEAQQAVQVARQQQELADEIAGQIDKAARQVQAARRRTDYLAREVTRALGAR